VTQYEPHPYALLLPALTDDEYATLKADIKVHGILYPVIVDEQRLVLDGVHRCRIAAELGIDVPVSQMGQMTDERKMRLAVGLNMRRRHLDGDRRRELVRKLHREQGFSVARSRRSPAGRSRPSTAT
jgi:ParB-like chromosome segregation protein Spo0J